MGTFYRCDICKQTGAERSVPDSWRKIVINDDNGDGQESYLCCTACFASFNNWRRDRTVIPDEARVPKRK